MDYVINSKVDLKNDLKSLIDKKVAKLEKFFDHILSCEIYLEEESQTSRSIEIKLGVKDSVLFCKEDAETFEAAIDLAVNCAIRQLKKYKETH